MRHATIVLRLALVGASSSMLLGNNQVCSDDRLTPQVKIQPSPAEPDQDLLVVWIGYEIPDGVDPLNNIDWSWWDGAEWVAVDDVHGPVLDAARTWPGSRWRACLQESRSDQNSYKPGFTCGEGCVNGGDCGKADGRTLAFAYAGNTDRAYGVLDGLTLAAGPIAQVFPLDADVALDPAQLVGIEGLVVWTETEAEVPDASPLQAWTDAGGRTLFLGDVDPLALAGLARPLEGPSVDLAGAEAYTDLVTGAVQPVRGLLHQTGTALHADAEALQVWDDGEPLLVRRDRVDAVQLSLNLDLDLDPLGQFAFLDRALRELVDGRSNGATLTGTLDPLPSRVPLDADVPLSGEIIGSFRIWNPAFGDNPGPTFGSLVFIDGAPVNTVTRWEPSTTVRADPSTTFRPPYPGTLALEWLLTTPEASLTLTADLQVNHPPALTLLTQPSTLILGQDLLVTATVDDADADPVTLSWFVDGAPRPDGGILASELVAGEPVLVELVADDGYDVVRSSLVLLPEAPVPVIDPMTLTWLSPDEGRLPYGPTLLSAASPTADLATLTATFEVAGDRFEPTLTAGSDVTFTATRTLPSGPQLLVLDAADQGTAGRITRLVDVNHLPPAPTVLLPSILAGTDLLLATAAATDLDGDALVLHVEWTEGPGGAVLHEGNPLPGAMVSPSRFLGYRAWFDDGYNDSAVVEGALIVPIPGTSPDQPQIVGLTSPTDRLLSGTLVDLAATVDHPSIAVDLLRCDVVEAGIVLAMAPVATDGRCVFAGVFLPDGPHALELVVTDPLGQTARQAFDVHLNRPPDAPAVDLLTGAHDDAWLELRSATDADGDPMDFEVTWARDDDPATILSTSTLFVAPEPATTYRWTLTAHDGFEAGTPATGTWRSAVAIPTPRAHFTFDDADASYGLHFSTVGSAYLFTTATCGQPGQVGEACVFATSDVGEDNASIIDPAADLCAAAWVKDPPSIGTTNLLRFERPGHSGLSFGISFGQLFMTTWSPTDPGQGSGGGPALDDGQWHHVIACMFTVPGGRDTIGWVDGQQAIFGGVHEEAPATTWIRSEVGGDGAFAGPIGAPFSGTIDELVWWDLLLDADVVQAL